MIKSAHKIKVVFTPITKREIDGMEFSRRILDIKGASGVCGGSYSSYPHIEGFSDDITMAEEIEYEIEKIILEHGGGVVVK